MLMTEMLKHEAVCCTANVVARAACMPKMQGTAAPLDGPCVCVLLRVHV